MVDELSLEEVLKQGLANAKEQFEKGAPLILLPVTLGERCKK